MDVELIPQGTLATRCMAAGYGMPAIFTPAGIGTEVAIGKEVRNFNGKDYLMEMAFDADFAIVKAGKATQWAIWYTVQQPATLKPVMAMAGKLPLPKWKN